MAALDVYVGSYRKPVVRRHRRQRTIGWALLIGLIVTFILLLSEMLMPYQGIVSRLVLSPADIEEHLALRQMLIDAQVIHLPHQKAVVLCPAGELSAVNQARWVRYFEAKKYPATPEYGPLCYDP